MRALPAKLQIPEMALRRTGGLFSPQAREQFVEPGLNPGVYCTCVMALALNALSFLYKEVVQRPLSLRLNYVSSKVPRKPIVPLVTAYSAYAPD